MLQWMKIWQITMGRNIDRNTTKIMHKRNAKGKGKFYLMIDRNSLKIDLICWNDREKKIQNGSKIATFQRKLKLNTKEEIKAQTQALLYIMTLPRYMCQK